MKRLTFFDLRAANVLRRAAWHTPDTEPWSGADWSNAMCGEAGETANVVKKLRRIETGLGNERDGDRASLLVKLEEELADTVIYLDLLAHHYGIDLGAAVVRKFDAISDREGFMVHLARPVQNLPETECLDTLPHEEHAWCSLSHRWWCPGVAIREATA